MILHSSSIFNILLIAFAFSPSFALYTDNVNKIRLFGSEADFKSTVLSDHELWVMQFYDPGDDTCKATALKYQMLAKSMKGVVNFGVMDASEAEGENLSKEYGVTSFPAFKLFYGDKADPQDYKMGTDGKGTSKFMSHLVEEIMQLINTRAKTVLKDTINSEDYIKTFSSEAEFKTKVMDDDALWVIHYCDPDTEECESSASKYLLLITLLKGIFKFGTIDASENVGVKLAKAYSFTEYPAFKLFFDDKELPQDYEVKTGENEIFKFASYLMDEVVQLINRRDIGIESEDAEPDNVEDDYSYEDIYGSKNKGSENKGVEVMGLSGDTFESILMESKEVWMVAFITTWCGHCQDLNVKWASANKKMLGEGVNFAVVDVDKEAELAKEYDVKKYPTIYLFPGGIKSRNKAREQPYLGEDEKEIILTARKEALKSAVAKEVREVTNKNVIGHACATFDKWCVVVALPHILESKVVGREKHISMLNIVMKQFARSAVDFFWFEAGSQPGIEATFGLNFGYPAVVGFSPSNNKYAVQRGSFTVQALGRFLGAVVSGNQVTYPFKGIQSILTTEPWNGKDGIPIEEEDSLEDILGWEEEL